MHEVEQYLRKPDNPSSLQIMYGGKGRTLRIINRECTYILAIGRRKVGSVFVDWENITKVRYPKIETNEVRLKSLIGKYIKEAKKANFTNPFIRKCLTADITKSAYENGITTGTRIDGKVISIKTLLKHAQYETEQFIKALENKQKYCSCKFLFQGYDCHFSISVHTDGDEYYQAGDVSACLSKEYKNTANGYYYLLINDSSFIGYDID